MSETKQSSSDTEQDTSEQDLGMSCMGHFFSLKIGLLEKGFSISTVANANISTAFLDIWSATERDPVKFRKTLQIMATQFLTTANKAQDEEN